MEQSSQDIKFNLESQLRKQYGEIVYTYTCHLEIINRYKDYDSFIKWIQILISGITSVGFISIIFVDSSIIKILGVIISLILFIVNACFKSFGVSNNIITHKKAADDLWLIREEYLSLLTDISILDIADIIKKRDKLIKDTSKVYKSAPLIDDKSYKKTQNFLKQEKNQYFNNKEIDKMLPKYLRRKEKI